MIKLNEDKIAVELTALAKQKILPEVLVLTPATPSIELSKVVYEVILLIVDKVNRPERKQECELLQMIEDVFTFLNEELISAGITDVEIDNHIDDTVDGAVVNIKVLCCRKVMLTVNLRAAYLIPLLNKRYKAMKLRTRV